MCTIYSGKKGMEKACPLSVLPTIWFAENCHFSGWKIKKGITFLQENIIVQNKELVGNTATPSPWKVPASLLQNLNNEFQLFFFLFQNILWKRNRIVLDLILNWLFYLVGKTGAIKTDITSDPRPKVKDVMMSALKTNQDDSDNDDWWLTRFLQTLQKSSPVMNQSCFTGWIGLPRNFWYNCLLCQINAQ